MRIFHISAECYPAAKTGGLGDVVGSLPIYQEKLGHEATVLLPKYDLKWIRDQKTNRLFSSELSIGTTPYAYSIEEVIDQNNYRLLLVNVPGIFDKEGIYSDPEGKFFEDSFQRWLALALGVLIWVKSLEEKPHVLHCHDHHTALIPFLLNYAEDFQEMKYIRTVFTIHNGKYQGTYNWYLGSLLPKFDFEKGGMLEWNNQINLLAGGVKCAWKVTTVSPSYMEELTYDSDGLEWLFDHERSKSEGILNGIDYEVWNPKKDPLIYYTLKTSINQFKLKNKEFLVKEVQLPKQDVPLISFIGRLVLEKGVDFMIDVLDSFLSHVRDGVQVLILGTGDPIFEEKLLELENKYPGVLRCIISYNEKLAHQIYAGSDFLLMPSRVEPCGLNQFYSMRYGTIPVVRRTGGLQDSVIDVGNDGTGICFNHLNMEDGIYALHRVLHLYKNVSELKAVRERAMELDSSWESSAQKYIDLYESII